MALKDLLKATTYDRYTQDGRDKLNEALAEDVRYKTGDISQKTGLQKQPDGSWAPPKKGGNGTGKPTPEAQKEMELRAAAATGDPEKRKALFAWQANKASDEEIDMVLSAKERGVNHPADFVEEFKKEKAKRSDNAEAEVGLHEGEENMPEFAQSYKLLSEEHDQDALESNAKLYPELQPLVKQRGPFVKKRIAAYTKLRDNPNNPLAKADFVDASNAINQIDADIDRAYKKATYEVI